MKKIKPGGAARLFVLALGVFFVIRAAGYVREIRGSRESIERCRKTLNDARPLPPGGLSRLEDRLAELRAPETAETPLRSAAQINPEEPAGAIRSMLRSHAVEVERLRTLSLGGSAATEFVLTSAPAGFLEFLQGAADIPLPLSYLSVKPDRRSSAINVTMRFNHAP
jgi:hypothetical protein